MHFYTGLLFVNNLNAYYSFYLYKCSSCYAVRVGVIYLLSGIGGSIMSSLFIQNNISVGASGALFGLLGAMLSELLTNWSIYANKVALFPCHWSYYWTFWGLFSLAFWEIPISSFGNERLIFLWQAAALFTLVIIIAINLAVGILPHVDNFAHIGGFLSGLLLGFVFLVRPQFGWLEGRHLPAGSRLKSKYTVYQYVLWIVAAILFITG